MCTGTMRTGASIATLGVGSMLRQDESWARRGGAGRDSELGLCVTASWDLTAGRVTASWERSDDSAV
jgi:hypothetical protein